LPGCSDLAPSEDPNSELFKIEVIQIPLAHPEQSHVVSKPGILADLGQAPRNASRTAQDSIENAARGRGGRGGRGARPVNPAIPPGPQQCHDITVYPAIGLAGGAFGGYGLLLDISDVAHPKRLYAAADSNMSFW